MKDSKRYILLPIILVMLIGGLILSLKHTPNGSYVDSRGAVMTAVLNLLTNQRRATSGQVGLIVNPLLTKAAEAKVKDMIDKNYFAHVSPEGKTPWYWISQTGYNFVYAGENLAVNFNESEEVTQAWMNSVTHRANLLRSQFTEVGTAVATGTFNGVPSTYIVQVYAHPRLAR